MHAPATFDHIVDYLMGRQSPTRLLHIGLLCQNALQEFRLGTLEPCGLFGVLEGAVDAIGNATRVN